jgi:hypothetical protein
MTLIFFIRQLLDVFLTFFAVIFRDFLLLFHLLDGFVGVAAGYCG